MFMIWMSTLAAATPVGDPVPRLAAGRVAVGTALEMSSHWLSVSDCSQGACDGIWQRSGLVGVGRLTIVDGLGLDFSVGRLRDKISQANYSGTGVQGAIGVRGAIPLTQTGWWLSVVAQYSAGQADNGDVEGGLSMSGYSIGTSSALLAWSPVADVSFTCWGGAQGAWQWSQTITPIGLDSDGAPVLEVDVTAGLPVSGVIGLSIVSEPLGAPWQPAWRLGFELEAMLGQSNLTSGRILVRF